MSRNNTGPEVPYNSNFTKPHVVILGAGASKQAFPYGEARGKIVPVMDELIQAADIIEYVAAGPSSPP